MCELVGKDGWWGVVGVWGGCVGRRDRGGQEVGLAGGVRRGGGAAVVGEDDEPGGEAGDDQQDKEGRPQRLGDDLVLGRNVGGDLIPDERQHEADHTGRQQQPAEILDHLRAACRATGGGSIACNVPNTWALNRARGLHRSWQRASSEQHSEQIGAE